jgi:hypothetical protein
VRAPCEGCGTILDDLTDGRRWTCSDCEAPQRARDQLMEALTRALTAQAWLATCCLLDDVTGSGELYFDDVRWAAVVRISRIPCPADLAAEILG